MRTLKRRSPRSKKSITGRQVHLLESVEGGQKWARYSFLGSGSPVLLHADADAVAIAKGSRVEQALPTQ